MVCTYIILYIIYNRINISCRDNACQLREYHVLPRRGYRALDFLTVKNPHALG